MMDRATMRRDLLEIFHAALQRVNGRRVVAHALEAEPLEAPIDLIAIGKAAASMARGVMDVCDARVRRGLIITKHGHFDSAFDKRFRCLASDHPVPGPASLQAGQELLAFCQSIPQGHTALFCLSGGTSSLVEVLPVGMTLTDLQTVNQILLGSGLAIDQMNIIRSHFSLLKGGRLAALLEGRPAQVLLISDVPGDNPAVIGSGPLYPRPTDISRFSRSVLERAAAIPHRVIANQKMALLAAKERAKALGYSVHLHSRFLGAEINEVATDLVSILRHAPTGVHLWGGEPVVRLPENAGQGGRNQHLALKVAEGLRGDKGLVFLAAGSDGTDGMTKNAGAMVDGESARRGALTGLDIKASLQAFDAACFLKKSGDLVFTGPTDTNVMDFMMAIKSP